MFQINRLHALLVVLAGLALVTPRARAQTESSSKPAWEVEVRKELPEHDPPFYRAYVVAGTNKFAMLLPLGYFFQGKDEGLLRLATAGSGSQITFAVRPPTDPHYADKDAIREYVLAGRPGAKITSEFSTGVGQWTGQGYDLTWKPAGGSALAGRVVVVTFEGGFLEYTGSTTPANFPAVQTAMDRFQRSLIVGKDGKLVVPHLSGRL